MAKASRAPNSSEQSSTLTVLGCGDAFGAGGCGQSSYLWQMPGLGILLDCGATVLPAMRARGLDTDDVDIIVISHFHGDHFGGLPFFILKAGIYGRKKPLTIFSPPGCEEKLRAALMLFYPGNEDALDKAAPAFISFNGHQKVEGGGIEVESFPVKHSPASLPHGVRIRAGDKTLAFSGDTAWTDDLVPLADSADLFICECSFFRYELDTHLTYANLKKQLPKLRAERILLTHFDDEMLEAIKANEIAEACAEDGLVLVL